MTKLDSSKVIETIDNLTYDDLKRLATQRHDGEVVFNYANIPVPPTN